ncbi:hypothetical protein D9M71_678920 [compost metagenome]
MNSQLNSLTPVGIEISMVARPKKVLTLAPEPMVKKWCSHTAKPSTAIAPEA